MQEGINFRIFWETCGPENRGKFCFFLWFEKMLGSLCECSVPRTLKTFWASFEVIERDSEHDNKITSFLGC